jgi:ZIP family zinc transporter
MVEQKGSLGLAIGLNIAAGLSTCIGGLVVFNKRLLHLAKPSTLGMALGMSAGVMIFISLVEIFKESVENFEKGFSTNKTNGLNETIKLNKTTFANETRKADCDEICKGHSQLAATTFFIVGVAIIYLMDYIVGKISPEGDPSLDINELNALRQSNHQVDSNNEVDHVEVLNSNLKNKEINNCQAKQSLNRMGILTAVAIAIHNLPEGVAVFIAGRTELKLGVTLAISIALHNIPEGVAVAAPVYFATGSRLKAFLWTFVSALAEPLGGLLCLLILRNNNLNPIVEGVLFGIVAGMMVTISIKGLLPTAYQYCSSKDKITYSLLVGMLIMAVSLILLGYAGL